MEGRLFLLSIWCGVYGQVLRWAFRRDRLVANRWWTVGANSLFWATFAIMGGMLVASYAEKFDASLQYALMFGGAGLVIGALVGYWRGGRDEQREALLRDNLEWADTGFSAIFLASLVMFFFVQAFKIPSGSMRMTFIEGDHLFVNKFVYGFQVPMTSKKVLPLRRVQVNDIVIFRFPTVEPKSVHDGKDFIKRAVALSGQEVRIINKRLYVDGVERKEPFTQHTDPTIYPATKWAPGQFQKLWQSGKFYEDYGAKVRDNFGPVVVPDGTIFVMGDNRDGSFDSRFWGPLDVSLIKGKAWVRYFPFSRFGFIK